MSLTQNQVAHFDASGFLLLRQLFAPAEMRRISEFLTLATSPIRMLNGRSRSTWRLWRRCWRWLLIRG